MELVTKIHNSQASSGYTRDYRISIQGFVSFRAAASGRGDATRKWRCWVTVDTSNSQSRQLRPAQTKCAERYRQSSRSPGRPLDM